MGADTLIEWADHTFNPWTGCQAVSPACDHCYAEAQAKRSPKTFGGWGPHAERKRTSESYWRQPLKWNSEARKIGTRPRVFCASMADIMDKAAPIEWFLDALDVVRITPHLIWLLLTKRPQMIRTRLEAALQHLSQGVDRGDLLEWIAGWLHGRAPANVWLGTTVENQAEAVRRIPHLLSVPAVKRFLSCEPLLGPVDLSPWWKENPPCSAYWHGNGLHWIIAGGESGPKARPSHPDWFRSLRDQCQAAGVPFFFKQWGEWKHTPERAHFKEAYPEPWQRTESLRDGVRPALTFRIGKKAAGATLDGREWREVPGA
ncbi:phage Gp37/Gp68 family protein [Roseomonas terrae]|uniref:Phage Gp37/Gp68 family protein n=1 Tax=Neoroseomonas terrae TaxID=424799 RepID=A0ABS5EQS5_9PROT|nr:phage Gp37/Gp68 family protein [Neoroseomonas terrae]MBR0653379.1 phage Gp37/Gp68 family protein [Neoroseomonas terrae]